MENVMENAEGLLREGIFVGRPVNDWVMRACREPEARKLWSNLWFEGEVACLFADSNLGKSIYAVQIADHISQSQPVVYFDFELSAKQFQIRYTDPDSGEMCPFSQQLVRAEVDPDKLDFLRAGADLPGMMVEMALRMGAKVLIVDNLTYICNDSESGLAAHDIMVRLTSLKKQYGLSILVLAHTPKRDPWQPLSQNDLAGSKRLFNFFDSVFAIGKSVKGEGVRYLKQLKARSCPIVWGSGCVLELRLRREGPRLWLDTAEDGSDVGPEREHLKAPRKERQGAALPQPMAIDEGMLTELKGQGLSLREIASRMGVSHMTVSRAMERMAGREVDHA